MRKETLAIGLIASMTWLGTGAAAQGPGAERGPSSSQSPYLVRTTPGIVTTSILTTGDSVVGYRMAGIPDGLGAFDNGDGTFTVLMHHEIPANLGVVRAHGGRGAFISKWVIDSDTLQVLKGEDLIKRIFRFDGTLWNQIPAGSPALNIGRLCSADLPDVSAYYDAASGLGTTERIFMGGEEIGDEGRVFGTVVTGRKLAVRTSSVPSENSPGRTRYPTRTPERRRSSSDSTTRPRDRFTSTLEPRSRAAMPSRRPA